MLFWIDNMSLLWLLWHRVCSSGCSRKPEKSVENQVLRQYCCEKGVRQLKMTSLIFCLCVALILVTSCGPNNEEIKDYDDIPKLDIPFNMDAIVIDYPINNSPIDRANAMKFSKTDLSTFFDENRFHSINDIHIRFPIEYFRCISSESGTTISVPSQDSNYYIIFPVEEGGNYLVFLCWFLDENQYRLGCWDSIYINNLPDESDFFSLESGELYSEFHESFPCTWLVTTASSHIVSYSPTKNCSIVRCMWKYERNEYVLENWENESDEYVSKNYPSIFLKDLFAFD